MVIKKPWHSVQPVHLHYLFSTSCVAVSGFKAEVPSADLNRHNVSLYNINVTLKSVTTFNEQ